jgi:hypothetical protein
MIMAEAQISEARLRRSIEGRGQNNPLQYPKAFILILKN